MEPGAHVLETEVKTYQKHHPQLLKHHAGEWVLIHKKKVIGFFPDRDSAVNAGNECLGNVDFFTRQIRETEPIRRAVSLRSNSQCR